MDVVVGVGIRTIFFLFLTPKLFENRDQHWVEVQNKILQKKCIQSRGHASLIPKICLVNILFYFISFHSHLFHCLWLIKFLVRVLMIIAGACICPVCYQLISINKFNVFSNYSNLCLPCSSQPQI